MKIVGYILTIPLRIILTVMWFCLTNTLGILWLISCIIAEGYISEVLSDYINGYVYIWRSE